MTDLRRMQGLRPRGALPLVPLLVSGLLILLVLVVLGPLMTITGTDMTGEGSPVRQGAYLLGALLIIFGTRPFSYPNRLLTIPIWIMLALGWCWISLFWAIEPGISLRRLILVSLTIWSVFLAVRHLEYATTLRLIRVLLVLLLVANYVALLWPQFAIHQFAEAIDPSLAGDWRGVMVHKNYAGMVCALTLILFLFDAARIPLILRLGVLAPAALYLADTASRTSIMALGVALIFGAIYLFYNARYRAAMLAFTLVAAIVSGIVAQILADPLTSHLTDNATLSGRPLIWAMLLRYFADNRWLGAGYGSFWNIGPISPVFRYGRGWITEIASGHCGYLDLLVQIGIPGLALVVLATVIWPFYRLFGSPAATGARGALIASLLTFFVVHNSTESSLFDRDDVGQIFLMITIALLTRITRDPFGYERKMLPFLIERPDGSRQILAEATVQ